jgi:hypothetical protein
MSNLTQTPSNNSQKHKKKWKAQRLNKAKKETQSATLRVKQKIHRA